MLDTDVVISALLFSGPPSQLILAWHSSRLRPVVSAPILDEYIRVLAYPTFELTPAGIRSAIEAERLPFIESVKALDTPIPKVRDPDDATFITPVVTKEIRWVVSGNEDLLSLHHTWRVEVISVTAFLQRLNAKP